MTDELTPMLRGNGVVHMRVGSHILCTPMNSNRPNVLDDDWVIVTMAGGTCTCDACWAAFTDGIESGEWDPMDYDD